MKNRISDQAIYLLGLSPKSCISHYKAARTSLSQVETRDFCKFTAWFIPVARDIFEGEEAEKNLADIHWLTPRVLMHQKAIETLCSEIPLCPASFGTLFSSDDKLGGLISKNERKLNDFFEQTESCLEYGLKCFVSWQAAIEEYNASHSDEEASIANIGKNYLIQRRMLRERDAKVRNWLFDTIQELEHRIGDFAQRVIQRPTPPTQNSGATDCIANWALLVSKESQERLHDWERLWCSTRNTLSCLRLQLTGPWPLYSFSPRLASSNENHCVL